MNIRKAILALSFLTLLPCEGAVIYQLTGTSSVVSPPFAVDFEATVPAFIMADTTIPAAGLDSCSTGFESCDGVLFEPVSSHDSGFSSIEFFTTNTSTLFFFDLNSFAAPGVYNTVFGAGSGTLTVTETTSGVPEPANWMLVLVPVAGLVVLRRRGKLILP